MPTKTLTREQVLTLLAEAPLHLAALTSALEPAALHAAPDPQAWTANDVLAHMRSCADVWGSCMAEIISRDRPVIRAVDPRTWIKSTDYLELEFHPSLHAYAAQRADLLVVLEPLAPEAWAREAVMTGAGKPIVRTLHRFAHRLAFHERPHIKQIERMVKLIRMQP